MGLQPTITSVMTGRGPRCTDKSISIYALGWLTLPGFQWPTRTTFWGLGCSPASCKVRITGDLQLLDLKLNQLGGHTTIPPKQTQEDERSKREGKTQRFFATVVSANKKFERDMNMTWTHSQLNNYIYCIYVCNLPNNQLNTNNMLQNLHFLNPKMSGSTVLSKVKVLQMSFYV